MGRTRLSKSAKQVVSQPLARTKQASAKPAAQKASKRAAKQVGLTAVEHEDSIFAVNPKPVYKDKLLWVIVKIVCEWVNYLGEVEGYFVKYEGFDHLDEYLLFFRNLFLKL
jgi:hypothetical protein